MSSMMRVIIALYFALFATAYAEERPVSAHNLKSVLREQFGRIPICWTSNGQPPEIICTHIGTVTEAYPQHAALIANSFAHIVRTHPALERLATESGRAAIDRFLDTETILACPGQQWRSGTVTIGGKLYLELNQGPSPGFLGIRNADLKRRCKEQRQDDYWFIQRGSVSPLSVLMEFYGQNQAVASFAQDYDRYYQECQQDLRGRRGTVAEGGEGGGALPNTNNSNDEEAEEKKKKQLKELEEEIKRLEEEKKKLEQAAANATNQQSKDQAQSALDATSDALDKLMKDLLRLVLDEVLGRVIGPTATRLVTSIGTFLIEGVKASADVAPWITDYDSRFNPDWQQKLRERTGRSKDCLVGDCKFASCEEEARVRAFRDAIYSRIRRDDCLHNILPDPNSTYTCPSSRPKTGSPLSEAEITESIREACRIRQRVAGAVVNFQCDHLTYRKVPPIKLEVCNDPRAMCNPDAPFTGETLPMPSITPKPPRTSFLQPG